MIDTITQMTSHLESAGARRRAMCARPSTDWSISVVANATAPKPYATPVANKAFGGHNTTLHPRPEEAPL